MEELVFESVETLTQPEFRSWVAERERRGDLHQYELLNGRVVMNPPAGYPHGQIGSVLQWHLQDVVRREGLGIVCDSSQGFELPSGDTVEPDHSFIGHERWARMPPPQEGEFLRVVPDLVIEVLSAKTSSRDRGEKKAVYERNGVREYWLVDWRARTVTMFLLDGGHYDKGHVFGEQETVSSQVLPGLSLRVGELFAGVGPARP